ncbi:MAG: hypothetical protein JXA54_13465 [Candidatus Heimdallarchaeota archaeon]|nr:hypothetical protein [Candidatus Heimdallarchaeota archaeon]
MSGRHRGKIAFSWSHYRELAGELFEKSAHDSKLTEAYLRSSISRAYYAAFCKARNYLRDEKDLDIPDEDTHKWVITQFSTSTESLLSKIGERLKRIRTYRTKADYDDVIEGESIDSIATKALLNADEAIEFLRKL